MGCVYRFPRPRGRSALVWATIAAAACTQARAQVVIPRGAAFDLGAGPGNTQTIDVSAFNQYGSIFWDADSASQDSQVNDPAAPPFGDTDLRDDLPAYITAGPGANYSGVSGGWNYQQVLAESGGTPFLGGVATTPASGGEVVAFTVGAGAPELLRLSLVVDILDGTQFVPSSLTVTAGDSSTTVPTTNVNRNGDVYSFDVLNVSPGDVIGVTLGPSASVNTLVGVLLGEAVPFELDLVIDRSTGAASIVHNSTGATRELKGYSLQSAGGALNATGWQSLQQQGQGDQGNGGGNTDPNDGVGWEVLADGGDATFLGEFNLQSSTLLGGGGATALDLGSVYSFGGPEDVKITYSFSDGSQVTLDALFIGERGLAGDFNADGAVNSADLTAPTVGFNARFGDDLGGRDLLAWQRNFGRVAGALSSSTAVPEPAGALACGMLITSCMLGRRRRARA